MRMILILSLNSVMSNPFEIPVDSQKRRQHFLKTAPEIFQNDAKLFKRTEKFLQSSTTRKKILRLTFYNYKFTSKDYKQILPSINLFF